MVDLAGTENRKGIRKKTNKTPALTARERTPRHISIPESAVRCHPRLADTDACCFLSLLYRFGGFCMYLVMFDPLI